MLVDGFLLYWHPDVVTQPDMHLFLRVVHDVLQQQRHERQGYNTSGEPLPSSSSLDPLIISYANYIISSPFLVAPLQASHTQKASGTTHPNTGKASSTPHMSDPLEVCSSAATSSTGVWRSRRPMLRQIQACKARASRAERAQSRGSY